LGEIHHFCFGFSHILLNQNIGEIINSNSSRAIYVELLNEITMLAAIKGLNLPNDIVMQTIHKQKNTKDATVHASRCIGWKKF
jgi:ketopantoate reductase